MSRQLLNCIIKNQIKITRTLVTNSKYGFLKELELNSENPGVFDGKWGGSGKVKKKKKNVTRVLELKKKKNSSNDFFFFHLKFN